MTESELKALLDAHDVLVRAFLDSSLAFSEFVCAYDDFPRNYSLERSETADDRAAVRLFGRRIAFHLRVSAVLSGLRTADDPADIAHRDAGQFLPAVGLMRLRELITRYPDLEADREFGA